MGIFSWLTSRNSAVRRAAWLHQRGMVSAKLGKHAAAIADYTAAIDTPGVGGELAAMALYNRALANHGMGNSSAAAEDLALVLDSSTAPTKIKTEARRKLLRIQRADQRGE